MSEVLGKCPVCGSNVIDGKYGPFCAGKCGFKIKPSIHGVPLTNEQISALLSGERILLEGIFSQYSYAEYDAYIYPEGIKAYEYTNKKGQQVTGYELEYDTVYAG